MRRLLLALAVLFAAACKDGSGPKPLPFCSEVRGVIVSVGTTPTISWTPACLAATVVVMRAPSDASQPPAAVWSITSDGGIAPDVRYGVTPPGATVTHAAEPLASGVLHSVNVIPDSCPPGGDRCGNTITELQIGFATFTP